MTALALGTADMRPQVPAGLIHMEPAVRTADWLEGWKFFRNEPVRSAPLWTIQRKPRVISLRRPLLVRVYSEEAFFFAANDTLSICGTGASIDDAISDFCLHAVHFYKYYRGLPSTKAIGQAVQLKAMFEELFVED